MGYFDGPNPENIHNWVCILERGTEYEIAMAGNYLSNLNIPSNILSKRDSSYNLNIGETSMVYLYVPKEYEQEARQVLLELEESDPLSEEMEEYEEDLEEFENEGGLSDDDEISASGKGGNDPEESGETGGESGGGSSSDHDRLRRNS
ncbi:MAG: hypothetical protein WD355_02355 [Balneolaceae bacterium]